MLKRLCLGRYLAALGLLVSVGGTHSVEAQAGLGLPEPPDAPSTSGPRPPAGLAGETRALASPNARVIAGVPAYLWYHGCGPTAGGMVLGYWDAHGYAALMPGESQTQTEAVNQRLASSEHYDDYALPLDVSPGPLLEDKSSTGGAHVSNSLADFMQTSWSARSNYYGWGWFSDVAKALVQYWEWAGYPAGGAGVTKLYMSNGSLTWDRLRAAVDAQHPLVFLVDTGGDGNTDHFITVVGYDEVDGVKKYGALNTWSTGVLWYDFKPMAAGQSWGVFGAILFEPLAVTVAGPGRGEVGRPYAFEARLNLSVTPPVTYTWNATDQVELTHTASVTDVVWLTWTVTGTMSLTVTAASPAGIVSDTRSITIFDKLWDVYLPEVSR